MVPDDPEPNRLERHDREVLLGNAHVAEYQALTTRTTYRLTLQFALWPILLIALTVLASAREWFGLRGLMWTGAATTQVVILHYFMIELEVYTDVQYIETQLRPMMDELLGDRPFWRYEHFLRDHRAVHPGWWEFWPISLGLAAIGFAGYWTFKWWVRDYFGLVMNIMMLVASCRLAYNSMCLREHMLGAV